MIESFMGSYRAGVNSKTLSLALARQTGNTDWDYRKSISRLSKSIP